MSQFGKASSKKGKPTYAYAIIGVALVLFLFGIVGWFFLNLRKSGDYFKENIQVHAYLSPTANKKTVDSLTAFISAIPHFSISRSQRLSIVGKVKTLNDSS